MSDHPTCKTCKWWEQSEDAPFGECRRNPPVPTMEIWSERDEYDRNTQVVVSSEHTRFPVTNCDQWCGEHRPPLFHDPTMTYAKAQDAIEDDGSGA